MCHRLRWRKWHILLSLGIHGDTDQVKPSQCDRDTFECLAVYRTGLSRILPFPLSLLERFPVFVVVKKVSQHSPQARVNDTSPLSL